MPDSDELERVLVRAHARVLERIEKEKRERRRRRATVWSGIAVVAVAAAAVAASPPLRAVLIPDGGGARAYLVVDCFAQDGRRAASNSYEDNTARTDAARADPVAVCTALEEQTSVLDQQDAIARQQRALGRECVAFSDSTGGSWVITGLQSPSKNYSTVGGPVPWRFPGEARAPALEPPPALAPSAAPSDGCTRIPTVTWKVSVPPMTACTTDGVTVDVYARDAGQDPAGLCSAKGMTVAGT